MTNPAKTSEKPVVKIGQVWEDNDPRLRKLGKTRQLRIDRMTINDLNEVIALCTDLQTQRQKSILVRRFKPTTNGYALIQDSEG